MFIHDATDSCVDADTNSPRSSPLPPRARALTPAHPTAHEPGHVGVPIAYRGAVLVPCDLDIADPDPASLVKGHACAVLAELERVAQSEAAFRELVTDWVAKR